MSQENPILDLTFKANADLSADAAPTTSQRYRAVKLGATAGEVVVVAAAADVIVGVQKNLPKAGALVDVANMGTTKARAGGAIAYGAYCKLGSTGKFVTGGGAADRNWGIALEAAGADGDIFELLLTGLVVTA
jgi:hypothetical protein